MNAFLLLEWGILRKFLEVFLKRPVHIHSFWHKDRNKRKTISEKNEEISWWKAEKTACGNLTDTFRHSRVRHIYCALTFRYSLLIEKHFCECRNVSVKFPHAFCFVPFIRGPVNFLGKSFLCLFLFSYFSFSRGLAYLTWFVYLLCFI